MNVKNIVTKSRVKKVVALAIVCAVAYGGGHYYLHQQKAAAHARAIAANETIIANEAAQQNIDLVDKDSVRTTVAAAIGQDESAITWKNVTLQDGIHQSKHHDKDHKDKGEHKKLQQANHDGQPPMKNAAPKGAPQAAADNASAPLPPADQPSAEPPKDGQNQLPKMRTPFHPVYMVKCEANGVRYIAAVDAVSGTVMHCQAIG